MRTRQQVSKRDGPAEFVLTTCGLICAVPVLHHARACLTHARACCSTHDDRYPVLRLQGFGLGEFYTNLGKQR